MAVLNTIDKEIIRELTRNGRLTNRELGAIVGLSPNAAGARVQKLIDREVITGFHAAINYAALGQPIEASVDLWQNTPQDSEALSRVVADDDRITECFHPTGPVDYRLRVRVASPEDLNDLLHRLRDEGNSRQTDSRLILERIET